MSILWHQWQRSSVKMYTEVSEARNRLDEETDLALPWARSGGGGSSAEQPLMFYCQRKGRGGKFVRCALDCLEIPLYSKAKLPLREVVVLRNRGLALLSSVSVG